MNKGYIYIWIDPAQGENILKIGKTGIKPKRKEEAHTPSGEPYIAYDSEVSDCDKAESLVHNRLRKYRHGKEKDIFKLSPDKAVAEVKDVAENLEKIEYYKKALTLEPNNASFYNNLGCSYDKLGNHAEAIEVCKRAIQLDPDNAVF
ncbi:MAG TPA: hypothetical protein DCQ37_24220, partial [Desulfobacteraceae bacterium]|nr:hypothetical protein [Desulfobacteraceae bacterium]